MKRTVFSGGLVLMAALACSAGCQPGGDPDGQKGGSRVSAAELALLTDSVRQNLLEAKAGDESLPGASVHILAPSLGLDWGTGVGFADAQQTVAYTSAHPIRISSVTKPFVAAAILRLQEQGRVELDAPISRYLTRAHAQIVREGPYNPDIITVRHLLTHTSGIVDVFNTQAFADYFSALLTGGEAKVFTLEEQVRTAVTGGEPTGVPGERQKYTDTGYILLGAMLETLTGENMAVATKTLSRYGEMGLNNTWWEVFEQPPSGALPRARQYYGEHHGDLLGAVPFDLFGGGGMISSAADLASYFQALFHGEVFEHAATLELMQSKFLPDVYEGDGEALVRHGVQAFEINGERLFGHGGWWGVGVYFSPQHDVIVVVNWLQQMAGEHMSVRSKEIVAEVMSFIEQHTAGA